MFGQALDKNHITALKQTVVSNDNDEEKVLNKGIDFEAFKNIMKKFIQKQKGQTCWKILKKFGYERHLHLS